MEKSVKRTLIETAAITAASFILVVFGTQANTIAQDNRYDSLLMGERDKEKKALTLTAEESALLVELEAELEISVEQIISELVPSLQQILLFDHAGNLVLEQKGADINPALLPNGAELLMTEGGIAYYLISR